MTRYRYVLKYLKSHFVRLLFPAMVVVMAGMTPGCQQSSDDDIVSSGVDSTAPTTTVTASSFCTLTNLTINACTSSPISVTFTANETATVYYAQGASSGVSVSTDSDSVESGGSISVSGTEGAIVYVAFFARDAIGNSESPRELTIVIPDFTDPITEISFVVTVDGSSCEQESSPTEYTCKGPITVTISYDDNTATTIYYDLTTDTASTPTTSSTQYTAPFTISANDSYLSFFAQDSANNTEAVRTFYFQIDGLTPSISGGYNKSTQSFTLSKSDNRTISGDGYYQIYYLKREGTDVSADSTADSDSVFASGSSPTANANAVSYFSTYPTVPDPTADTITADATTDETNIYQFKYNLVYDGTQDATGDIQNGTIDKEATLVLYIDTDSPKAFAVPPSSGSLSSTISITTYFQDNGHNKIDAYAATNPNLAAAVPLQSPTATYCRSTTYTTEDSNFWKYCLDTGNKLGLTSGVSVTLTADTLVGLTGRDAADNPITCDPSKKQFSCEGSPLFGGDPHYVELYTPGRQQTSYYHENEDQTADTNLNFGHAVAAGDLDGDGTSDIIAIGAPAYSYTDSGAVDVNKGAVYLWYNDFRERALLTLIDNDVTTDVSSRYLEFATDGFDSLRIFLDPSDDTSSYGSALYQAASGAYSDKTRTTATEIATVLNKAFLSSFGKSYQNYLYADASTDGKLSVGHVNRTIQGSFTYTGNFDATSDFYYAGNSIRAYDYVIYGENDNDEFGYSLAFGRVDTSTDTALYSASQLVVGAPGYDNDNGALYIIRIPPSDASADYGSVTLFDSTDDVYKIYDTTGDGRLGHAVVLYDNTSDGYLDIYTAAPYYSTTHTNGGKIYKINQQVFTYSDATNDIATVAASSYVWTTADNDDVDAAESLFGYSLAAGYAKYPPFGSSSKYLFVGIPGSESSINGKGKVASFFIHSGASLLENQTPPVYKVFDATGRAHFGSSLAIVASGFDTSGTGYCPCLAVGAPGETTDLGNVWVLGDFSYSKSLSGSSAYDRIGVNLLAGKIEPSFSTETLFITAKSENDKGHLVIVKSQPLTTGTEITAEDLNGDLAGTVVGDNLGQGLAIVSINGVKGLLTGLAGRDDRMGSVRIYSDSRLNN